MSILDPERMQALYFSQDRLEVPRFACDRLACEGKKKKKCCKKYKKGKRCKSCPKA